MEIIKAIYEEFLIVICLIAVFCCAILPIPIILTIIEKIIDKFTSKRR